jgi:hypothetical protein
VGLLIQAFLRVVGERRRRPVLTDFWNLTEASLPFLCVDYVQILGLAGVLEWVRTRSCPGA